MRLNTLKPTDGSKSKAKRVGRGIGSGLGKTCGRGHKGLKSRSGGSVKPGFEGGQMPIQRRLPKFGFTSRVGLLTDQVTLTELGKVEGDIVSLETLKSSGLIKKHIKHVKVILSGEINRTVKLQGVRATKGAKEAIIAAGGSVEE